VGRDREAVPAVDRDDLVGPARRPRWTSSRSRNCCAPARSTATCGGCACVTGAAGTARSPGSEPARARGIAAGLHLVLELEGIGEAEALARAGERSRALYPLGPYWHAPHAEHPQALVLGYAAAPEHTYEQTLAALADVLSAPPR
jgi:hypothetical protein